MVIVKRSGTGKAIPPPGGGPVGAPPPKIPKLPSGWKSWEAFWKSEDQLNRQNPTMTLTAKEMLTHTRTAKDQDDNDAADVAKKKARVAAIRAAKKKSWVSVNVSGYGTVSPILSGYPSGTAATETGAGFSWSSIPAIVWIILAVGGGIYLIKSAGKRGR
jgi:hypothetical protein